jgi:hypothetical protein
LAREGDRVRFRVSDIFLPVPEHLSLTAQEMEGVIVQFSDSGQRPRMFASVEVVIHQTVVVEVDKLQILPPLRTATET